MTRTPAIPPTVYLVDGDDAFRNALARMLATVGHHVAAFAAAEEFLAACVSEPPGCLLVEARLPGMSGRELQDTLRERGWTLPVVFATAHGSVPLAVSAMRSGALDVLEKPVRDSTLIGIVAQALAHDARQRRERAELDARATRLARLTPREREVLELVLAGTTNKDIAQQLGISTKTVEVHRARVMGKLEVESLAELVHFVVGAARSGGR